MNIVVAHEAIDGAGGVETYLTSVIPALQARGHRVAVLFHHGQRGMPVTPDLLVSVQEQGIEGAFGMLRRWGAQVYFSHNMAPLDVERRAVAEWPVVKMMHGYFGTCVGGSKSHGFPTVRACDRVFGVGCLALYVPRRCGELHPATLVNGYRWATAQRTLFSRYAAVVVPSAHMGREYSRHGVARDRLNVLPLFSTLMPEAEESHGDAVLFAGRMTKLKGGDVLIRAIAEVTRQTRRGVPLIMAGAGPQKKPWQRLAESLGIAAEFPGWVEGAHRTALFRRASLLVVPSLWPEPFGLVGLEAAAFGVPAVAFDVGGVREWLRHEVNGRLVRPSEGAPGLASAIHSLLVDPGRRRRMAHAARELAQEMSLDTHIASIEQVLGQAMAAPK